MRGWGKAASCSTLAASLPSTHATQLRCGHSYVVATKQQSHLLLMKEYHQNQAVGAWEQGREDVEAGKGDGSIGKGPQKGRQQAWHALPGHAIPTSMQATEWCSGPTTQQLAGQEQSAEHAMSSRTNAKPDPLCISLSMPLREVCLRGQRHVLGWLLVSSFTHAYGVKATCNTTTPYAHACTCTFPSATFRLDAYNYTTQQL